MKFSLEELGQRGAFAGAPVETEITWKQDHKDLVATIWVRRLSYASTVAELKASNLKADAIAARIAACILDEAGAPVFSPGDITGEADPERGPLSSELTMALLAAIHEVNEPGKTSEIGNSEG